MKVNSVTGVLFAVGILGVCGGAQAQSSYQLIHSYVSTLNFNGQGGMWENTAGQTVNKTLSGSEWYLQEVTGAGEPCPWTAKFTPLSAVSLLNEWEETAEVPAGKWMIVDTKYLCEDGSERWKKVSGSGGTGGSGGEGPVDPDPGAPGGEEPSFFDRERTWYIPNGVNVTIL